jgi:hypothetical protein
VWEGPEVAVEAVYLEAAGWDWVGVLDMEEIVGRAGGFVVIGVMSGEWVELVLSGS